MHPIVLSRIKKSSPMSLRCPLLADPGLPEFRAQQLRCTDSGSRQVQLYVRAYPASRWLRTANTNTVSISSTY